jgi:hypothetical protein
MSGRNTLVNLKLSKFSDDSSQNNLSTLGALNMEQQDLIP